ncbi:hypothetical protein EV421DRAFT_1901250 [Armillaria borealis]|uniref:Uncharacterized protein n=1 Tax=Armillaria borealis TaxID=47425 RepID=A0AA39JRE9_9AGAR|nr:hypothetical protein EV421DRAFT_1901250 [Armillaria borealis]
MKESSGAGRRGYFLVDRPNDNLSPDDAQANSTLPAASSSTISNQSETSNSLGARYKKFRRWDPPDPLSRLVILRNIGEALNVQDQCPYDITASMNTPPNLTPYTICTVLGLATGAHIKRTSHQGKHSWPGQNESDMTPEKVKSLWEDEKVVVDQEFDTSLKELRVPGSAVEEALKKVRNACQVIDRERAARLQAEAELNELRATLARLEQPAGDASVFANV